MFEKFISPFIENQFPEFYKTDGPNFIAFIKAYYEWLEISDKNKIYFKNKNSAFIPGKNILVNEKDSVLILSKQDNNISVLGNLGHLSNGDTFYQIELEQDLLNQVNVSSNIVTGIDSNFSSDLNVGEYLLINDELRKIILIGDDFNLKVDSPFSENGTFDYKKYILSNETIVTNIEVSLNPLNASRNIEELTDIDLTLNSFVNNFSNEYMPLIPKDIKVDKKFLIKKIQDLYRSKGTDESFKLLFRIIFNEDVDINYPSDYIFTSSDSEYHIPKYIEIVDVDNIDLSKFINKGIYGSSSKSTAVVEDFFMKIVNNRLINVLMISNVIGSFVFGEKIFCDELPEISPKNSPTVFGSLSSVSIINGGLNFNDGDILEVVGTGGDGKARVVSTRNENGKVTFKLVNGGFGFSMNAVIYISGGFGSGASFKIGGLVNKETISINTDVIEDYLLTQYESPINGFTLNIANTSGTFTNAEYCSCSGNVVTLDVKPISGSVANGESLSNTSLGITDLIATNSQDSFLQLVGTDISNANLVSGIVLVSNTSNSSIEINTNLGIKTVSGNGQIYSVNSTSLFVRNQTGYFTPTFTLTGETSEATGDITSTIRLTNWEFPIVNNPDVENLDTPLENVLSSKILEIGTISYIDRINPGIGYSSNPTVTIMEPDVYALSIPDGYGGYKGYDAVITATAGTANGIVQGVEIIDSGYGYNPNELVNLVSANSNISVSGLTIVKTNGIGQGYWKDNKSRASGVMRLIDSDYYQTFSYELIAKRMLSTYEKFVKDVVHPSGFKLFGKFVNKTFDESPTKYISSSFSQT